MVAINRTFEKAAAAKLAEAAKFIYNDYKKSSPKGPFGSGNLYKPNQYRKPKANPNNKPLPRLPKGVKRNPNTSTSGSLDPGVSAKTRRKPNNYAVRGSILKTENGGVSTATTLQSLYLGHGLATRQVARAVCRAIVRQLFSQAGVTFTNWSDGLAFTGKICVYYVENPAIVTPVIGGFETTVTTSDTYITASDAVLASLITNFVQGYDYEFTRFYLVDSTNTNPMVVAQMMAKQMEFDIAFTSRLAVQNKTTAQSGDLDENDVDNNPLVGKVYGSPRTWANYIEPKDRSTGNMANSYTAARETGIITVKSVDTNTTALQKPPPAYFFNFKKESKITINPGHITNNYLRWSVKGLKLNTLLKKMPNQFASNSEKSEDFGTVGLIGLEKLLDSQRTSGSGVAISVGYEINQQYSVCCNYKKFVPSTTILEVGASQITSS